jgi:hypothetical protein
VRIEYFTVLRKMDRLGFEPRTSRDLDVHSTYFLNAEIARRALLPLNYRPEKYSARLQIGFKN